MEVVYVGPHEAVIVDEFSLDTVIDRGEPVDIPDKLAASLLDQTTWEKAKKPAPTKKGDN